ncbi:MAG: DUF4843 domain-containing protein [Bacteroidales bacterium]|nr:DUF4843 domain-containing protein [Bacteroidales bacterium]
MNRRISTYICVLSAFLSLVGCQERTPMLFGELTGVYFNNRATAMTLSDSLDITFVYEKEDEVDVPVKIQLVGRASDEPRPISVTVSSDNALSGTDYLLPESPVLPAGASETDYVVRLRRTDALKTQVKYISLRIHANEYFDLPVKEMVQAGDTVSTLDFTICFSDMFTKPPVAWDENLVGEFSQQKFELVCKVLELDPADFNDATVITLAKLLYIRAEITAYIAEQMDRYSSGESYDEDIFDSQTGLPLEF